MPISSVRSVTVASMMFMMPMPPTTSEIEANRHDHHFEDALRAALLRQQLRRRDDREVAGLAVRHVEQAAHQGG